MWTRKELKDRAKVALKKSYWKAVLVSVILMIVSGGVGAGSSYRSDANDFTSSYDENMLNDDNSFDESIRENQQEAINEVKEEVHEMKNMSNAMVAGFVVGLLTVFIIVFTVSMIVGVFIFNPLVVGARRFFVKELSEGAKVKEVAFAFDNSYKNIIKIVFFKDLFIFLWSLLLIVPGIIKAYEYRMIPYLLAEYPDMDKNEAFIRSKELMKGQKWKTFVLDLSFFGWNLLSCFTLGILSVFYVLPYKNFTDAALYHTLTGKVCDVIEA